ncbi:MAG: calcium/sodium antiporter [Planctomycetes bacterium]|nr:calcium/sodium antiporter [Planctomycetota bacterium]MCB9891659.1 calcium/sodium antiporter [Planctomycetota bacterium]
MGFLTTTILGQIVLIVLGGVAVWIGAEALVRGASRLAKAFGISEFIIGATIVAFGTSAPEWIVSFMAQLEGNAGISLGNIIGSNVANLGLGIGIPGVIIATRIGSRTMRRELVLVILAQLAFTWFCADERIGFVDGALLLAGFFAVFAWILLSGRKRRAQVEALIPEAEAIEADEPKLLRDGGWTLFGLALLLLGARYFVIGAEAFAREMGIGAETVGLTIVAIGTSLPELVTSTVACLRGQSELSIGNLLGSNLFNVLLVGGSLAVIDDVAVPPGIHGDFWWMNGITIAVLVFALVSKRVVEDGNDVRHLARLLGALLGLAYVAYLITKVLQVA